MSLVTNVKVGMITNLSDARYCAGMGVERLGVNVIAESPNYISPVQWQDIQGWINGPKTVAEVYGIKTPNQLNDIATQYNPDFLEMNLQEFHAFRNEIKSNVMLCLQVEDRNETLSEIKTDDRIDSFIVHENDLTQFSDFIEQFRIFIIPKNTKSITGLLSDYPTAGFILSGSEESKPGLKNYDELAEVLEQLEEV
ncbi:MAG: hypothetical protein HC811_07850 [Flammeovirgaceae bacterium]|nr:hypothetical protein [Flammeovirgaceae bacterium]